MLQHAYQLLDSLICIVNLKETLLIRDLKGHCHEDFAVLGEFCAKIITLRL